MTGRDDNPNCENFGCPQKNFREHQDNRSSGGLPAESNADRVGT